MCGIVGIVDLKGRRPVERGDLERMNAALRHRGPDGDGFHVDDGVGFGHRRLSIIDLEGGKQPLYNEDGSVVVTYNGEIYNFRELEQELKARGHVFRTRCDTEVIVHAWEEWGKACVERFNGMFAFAIWDARRQSLFLARDRLGVKPLYYTILPDGRLLFGSELKALLCCKDVPRRIDVTAVEDYFTFGYVPDPKSIFVGIHKLAPAHRVVFRRGSSIPEPERYWDVPLFEPASALTEESASAELIAHLRSAVERRLVSDVPLGAFLSGGVDSSAVVAMMRDIGVANLLTCSIGFHEPKFDESKFASLVATALETEHRTEIVDAYDFSIADQLVDVYDEPYADSSAIPTYRVCQLARRHVTVALSGDGGDEDFLGYRRYRLFAMEERLRSRLPLGLRQRVFAPLGHLYPKLDWAPRFLRGKTTFQSLARTSVQAYLHGVGICSDEMRGRLFSEDLKKDLGGYRSIQVFDRVLRGREFSDPLRMVQYLDYHTYLPGDILTKVDRASMAHSLEVRVPFLDYTFVEWAARIPSAAKLRGLEGKRVLKRALQGHLPNEVLYRTKMGFAVPIEEWFRRSLRERIAESLESGSLAECGMFSQERIRQIVHEHHSGSRNHSSVMWSLLMFDGFLRKISVNPAYSLRN